MRIFRRALYWIGLHERDVLVALVLAAAAVWGFAELADEIDEAGAGTVDARLLLAFRASGDPTDPLGPGWLEELARDVTALGSLGMISFLTLATAGFLVLQQKKHIALYLVLAVGSGVLISMALKAGFSRPRPDLVPHAARVYTSSFPSGHSMTSAVTFLTLGALLAGTQPRWRLKAYFLVLAVLLTILVGVSRVYLGVHWPTDVLGGWTAGSAWALLCWVVAERLRRRGRVE